VSQWTGPSEQQSLAAMPLCTLDSFKLQILPRDGASVPSGTAGAREFHIDPLARPANTQGITCSQECHTSRFSQGSPGFVRFNHLTPNGHYMGRTAQLTSRCCILYIYSANIRTEYFKHAA